MKSKLTGGPTTPLFTATVLGRHQVTYHRCDQTGFIQTDEPHWLDEAYSEAITQLDIGLLGRNLSKVELTCRSLHKITPNGERYLDYGGGYGIFTRLMRDSGYPFLHHDPHCECLFAKGFEIECLESDDGPLFDCVTAWEVFEHLADPLNVFESLTRHSNALFFSTVLVPTPQPTKPSDWWYFTPETGQHVSFYTLGSLEYVADQLGWHLYSDNEANHVLTRERLPLNPFRENPFWRRLHWLLRGSPAQSASMSSPNSLSGPDYETVLAGLRAEQAALTGKSNRGTDPGDPSAMRDSHE